MKERYIIPTIYAMYIKLAGSIALTSVTENTEGTAYGFEEDMEG